MTKATPLNLNLIKIKNWFFPESDEDFNILKDLGLPLIKIHEDFLPTLKLLTTQNNITGKIKFWKRISEPYFDHIGTLWLSKSDRKCKLDKDTLVFTGTISPKNKKAVDALEASLNRFFERWGFFYDPVYSEKNGRFKLFVTYRFGAPPVLEFGPEPNTVHEALIGFTKVRFTFYDKTNKLDPNHPFYNKPPQIHLEFFIKAGATWQALHSQKLVVGQVGDLTPLLSAFGKILTLRGD